MSRFGWAYVNSLVTGAVANGPTNSVQFNSGSQVLSGSSNFTFDPSTNKVTLLGQLTGSTLVISASVVSASTYLGIPTGSSTTPGDGDKSIQFNSGSTFSGSNNLTFDYTTNTLFLTGTLRADNLIVSSSQILKSGSTIFGDDISDTHQFTGSILGGIVSGTIARFIAITGSTITGSTGLFGVVTSSAFSGGSFVGTTISGTTAQFTTITGSIVTGSTALFTTLTASAISANSIPAFGANQTIQYNNSGVLNGSTNLTFDGTQVRLTGSMQVVSGSTIVTEILASGVRTTGKPVQVRNVSSNLVGVIDENGTVSGSIGSFGTVTGSVLTSSNEILIANNATIGGNILGSGAIKGAYATYTGSFTIPSNSYFVGISSTGSVITASLSSATNYPAGQTLYLKDTGGNAAINNIRIQPSGSQTIDGATGGVIIASNSGSATLISNGVDGFYIIGLT